MCKASASTPLPVRLLRSSDREAQDGDAFEGWESMP
ncbi:unnamed protein product [Strongylus vulgaris]|uniref:Uncharacterized protein n=1 Tax=Strongylus vulgaris TaxID=40348 RepID=A0A3P7LUS9_STRVU|nr:unnamed protein product [Strongylus vulgaris]